MPVQVDAVFANDSKRVKTQVLRCAVLRCAVLELSR